MQLPFTTNEFFQVFREYNLTVWPAQFVLLGLGVAVVTFIFRPRKWSGQAISTILALFWLWIGLAYHVAFFSQINAVAYGFAALSLVGAGIFLWEGLFRRRLQFSWMPGARGTIGIVLVGFALVIYPAWSWIAGHSYPAMPTFGLPCPTAIFSIGALAFLVRPYPRSPFIVPILWCVVGSQAAFQLDVPQDLSLIFAGVVALILLVLANRSII